MKKVYNITQKAAVAVLAILLAASCVFEKENPVGHYDARQHVAVQLGIGTEGMAQTKADDNTGIPITTPDAENPVSTIETKIKTLRIYAYTKEGANYKLCGYYQAFAKADGTFNTTGHVMDLNLPASGTVDVYFRAVANESAMLPGGDKTGSIAYNYAINVGRDPQTGGLTFSKAIGFDELNSILYSVDQKFENGMPMYADQKVSINVDNVGSMNTADGHNGHFILQETVNLILTRSLAKIMVYAAQAVDGTDVLDTQNPSITIDKVTYFTEGILESGYLFPTENYPDDITTNDDIVFEPADGGVKKMIGTQNTSNIGVPANYTPITDPYYIPENPNGADTWNQVGDTEGMVIRIDYTYTGSSSTFAYVKMPPMVRNTFYKVLCLINAAGKIEIKYIVTDWIIADINVPNFE